MTKGSRENAWASGRLPHTLGTTSSASKSQPKKRNPEGRSSDGAASKPKKFEDACAEIQSSIKNYLEKHNDDEMFSSDEEDETPLDQRKAIIDQLTRNFVSGGGDLDRTTQYLENSWSADSCACLICIAVVKKTDSTWQCASCFTLFHLSCIQKWGKDSLFQLERSSEENPVLGTSARAADPKIYKERFTWPCPKCRAPYQSEDVPRHYLCYCGKQTDPPFDPWGLPHSCGEVCHRPLDPHCGHRCLLLCHPGPCPPCPVTVTHPCHCGHSPPTRRRCCNKEWDCGKTCKAVLDCGVHLCSQPCHKPPCPPCAKTSRRKCCCGKQEELRPCADGDFSCGLPCKKPFPCGRHTCERICHPGPCGDCPWLGKKTCPCGKNKVVVDDCSSDAGPSPCGDTCGRPLECGRHDCALRCHEGPCGVCNQMTTKRCRCGARQKEVPCAKEYLCETKCKRIRDCGRHACNRKCCDGNCPPCDHPCGRPLACRNHRCSSRCHQGPCYPCFDSVILSCRCGASQATVACGREKTARRPRCRELCQLPLRCHHPSAVPHACHEGECPPCKQKCLKPLPCGHSCPQPCHSSAEVIVKGEAPQTPWEQRHGVWKEIRDLPCPPCREPVSVPCLGKHSPPQIFACCEARVISCGRPCGQLLSCQKHRCELECHPVRGDTEEAGTLCPPCTRDCGEPRPPFCPHPCPKGRCHPGHCPSCQVPFKVRCHCGLSQLYKRCESWGQVEDKEEGLKCGTPCPKQMSCGHPCPLTCHPGPCPSAEGCRKRVNLRCPCRRIKQAAICCEAMEQGKGQLPQLKCDQTCLELKRKNGKEQESESSPKPLAGALEEELRRQEEELLLRKLEGRPRRRKKRAVSESGEGAGWPTKVKLVLALAVVGVSVGLGLYLSG